MSTTRTQLPRDLETQVGQAARHLGISRERFVREALTAHLPPALQDQRRSFYELSRDLCGSVTGGPRDLARHEKKYLGGYGAWRR
ncbi:MAG: hypothetical protein KGS61_14345 [Verrucomicrobia bacterium]|nr:hypothetical protein [Verrucomicrobiota bacterium]